MLIEKSSNDYLSGYQGPNKIEGILHLLNLFYWISFLLQLHFYGSWFEKENLLYSDFLLAFGVH